MNVEKEIKTLIPYETIMKVFSSEKLLDLYREAGADVSNKLDEKSEEIIKADWKNHKTNYQKKVTNNEVEDKPHNEVVEVDGVKYTVIGFAHADYALSEKYKLHLEIQTHTNDVLLAEELTTKEAFKNSPARYNVLEIDDHNLISIANNLIEGIKWSTIGLKSFIKDVKNEIMPTKKYEHQSIDIAKFPSELLSKLPPVLRYEKWTNESRSIVKNILNTSKCEKRSAYMAEFMKQYQKGKDKTIFVGDKHRSEIIQFIKNGVKNKKIVREAKRKAERAEKHPKRYHWIKEIRSAKQSMELASGITTATVATAYICYEGFQLAKNLFENIQAYF